MSALRLSLIIVLCAISPLFAAAGGKTMTIEIQTVDGTGDDPIIMVWLETTSGDFVKTLQIFSKDKKWYKDLTVWAGAREGVKSDPIDAVVGPTIKWSAKRLASIPVQVDGINLLDGSYQIHIEQRKDKGGHYKKLRVPLPANFGRATIENEGYIKQLTVAIKSGGT
jgi:hypothetical protein